MTRTLGWWNNLFSPLLYGRYIAFKLITFSSHKFDTFSMNWKGVEDATLAVRKLGLARASCPARRRLRYVLKPLLCAPFFLEFCNSLDLSRHLFFIPAKHYLLLLSFKRGLLLNGVQPRQMQSVHIFWHWKELPSRRPARFTNDSMFGTHTCPLSSNPSEILQELV